MKKWYLSLLLTLALAATAHAHCGNCGTGDEEKAVAHEKTGGYTCQMCPKVHSEKAGPCPKCGMELKAHSSEAEASLGD